jgi:hypothetical protein
LLAALRKAASSRLRAAFLRKLSYKSSRTSRFAAATPAWSTRSAFLKACRRAWNGFERTRRWAASDSENSAIASMSRYSQLSACRLVGL